MDEREPDDPAGDPRFIPGVYNYCDRWCPDHEDAIFALGILKCLLRQVEATFPNARAFRRPGFDTMDGED